MSVLAQTKQVSRCAIYTRKSIEQGLEREFNSLEGQRTICSAYIASQRPRGWRELPTLYDDAAQSGRSLERPALQRLLADVEAGAIDVVVIYKIDRLTRTLLDFVRLADLLERYGVSFVSVTQHFDTNDSTGRLVLNVLLTFAQFEREMCADRIRDKILATKKSGRWAGGPAPLGYDLVRRRLLINDGEAAAVRHIFDRYLALENLTAVYRECRAAGMCSKRWRTRAGNSVGGGPITKALVYHVLGNPIYVGEIRHRDDSYAGLHAAIIDRGIWNQVQAVRARQANKKAARNKDHILTDLLFDAYGRPMSVYLTLSTHCASRYYVSRQSAWGKRQGLKPMRAKADEIEHLVVSALAAFVSDKSKVRMFLLAQGLSDALDPVTRDCAAKAIKISKLPKERLRSILRAVVERVELAFEQLALVLRCCELERLLGWDGIGLYKAQPADWGRSRKHIVEVPAATLKYQRLLQLPIKPKQTYSGAHPAPSLKRLITEARFVQALVDNRRDATISQLASEIGYTPARFARVLRLNYLAPDIILAVIDGTHPRDLTRSKLVQANLPMNWALQRKLLGFPDQPALNGGD